MNKTDYKLSRDGGREKVTRAMYSPKSFRVASTKTDAGISAKTVLIIGIVVACVYGLIVYADHETDTPVPLPDNGSVIQYRPIGTTSLVAPFKVITNSSSVTTHYLVLVSDWNTSAPVMAMFIFGGREAQTMLPIGTYRVSIAKGTKWYGMDHLFGKKTVQTQGAKPINLYQSASHQTMGAIINLNEAVDGNYPMDPGGLITKQ